MRVEILAGGAKYRVFISHASADLWVAKQIEAKIRQCGAVTFLDSEHIERGDDFEERIEAAARDCDELVILLTPAAKRRKYVWMEIGMFLGARKRVVTILYGLKPKTLASDPDLPLAIKRRRYVDINEIESYFVELSVRANAGEAGDV